MHAGQGQGHAGTSHISAANALLMIQGNLIAGVNERYGGHIV